MTENSTVQNVQSGEQTGAVDQQESYNPAYDNNDKFDRDDSQTGAVDQSDLIEDEEDDVSEDTDIADPDDADQDSDSQTREDNAIARQARLRAAQEAKQQIETAKLEAVADADKRVAGSGIINPYTKLPFASVKEIEEYGKSMHELNLEEEAKKLGKTVEQLKEDAENAAYIKRKRHEESEAEKAKQKELESRRFIEEDIACFTERYPDVDLAKLDANEKFRKFCGSRYGKEPLADIYADYIDIVGEAQKQAEFKRKSKSERSTGTGASGGEMLTSDQKRDLEEWNAQYPELTMTPKEFLSRN